MRFLAPPHVGTAFLSTGPIAVVDGAIEVSEDLPHGDRRGLIASGFTLAPAPIAKPAPAKADPAQPKGD